MHFPRAEQDCHVSAHDITPLVRLGPKAVGLLAGHVIQSHPAFSRSAPFLRAILVVQLSDNTSVCGGHHP